MFSNPKFVKTLLGGLGLSLTLTGCTDSLDLPGHSGNDSDEPGITIYLPNMSNAAMFGKTRAEDAVDQKTSEALEAEAAIDNLYLIAIDEEGEVKPYNLKDYNSASNLSTSPGTTDDSYTKYVVTDIERGKYKFYVLGNLDNYLGDGNNVSKLNSETAIKEAVLDFTGTNNGTPIIPGQLPMACMKLKLNSPSAEPQEEIDLGSKGNAKLYADMQFLCAKVRYTILFDESQSEFEGSVIDFDASPLAHNIRTTTRLVYDSAKDKEEFFEDPLALPFAKTKYPKEEGYPVYDDETGKVSDNLEVLKQNEEWEGKRAWQGIAYLPENLKGDDDISYITFTGVTDKEKSFENEKTYTIELPLDKSGMERSKFIDIRAEVTSYTQPELELTVNVSDWNLKEIQNQLHGPYELIVETTELEVHAGYWSENIWYRSDVTPQDITFEYPLFDLQDGKDPVNFYVAEVVKDPETGQYLQNDNGDYLIHIRVNPVIPYNLISELNKLPDTSTEKQAYAYFHIVAGAIHKKINITPLVLDPYLTVSPTQIDLSVGHYVASGTKNTVIEIEFDTNVDTEELSFTFTKNCSSHADPDRSEEISDDIINNLSNALYITGNEGVTITGSTNGKYTINRHQDKLMLNLTQLFEGAAYWNESHSYTLTFHIDTPEDFDGEIPDVTVNITVAPYTTNYIIHFKNSTQSEEWEAPHVYIYQCLELPLDLQGPNSQYAGRTVGYKALSNDWKESDVDKANTSAALEHLFTPGYSFRGWYGYGGPLENNLAMDVWNDVTDDDGNPMKDLDWFTGFIIFDDSQYGNSFKPDNEKRYFVNYNLNDAHTSRMDGKWTDINGNSEACAGEQWQKRMWPGMLMEREYDSKGQPTGWWRYTLSGVATPGKAMIMFKDTHNDGIVRRYPANDEVGVPLFDFPGNEGWFVYDGVNYNHGLNFYSSEPVVTKKDRKARIYWLKNWPSATTDWNYLHYWDNKGNPYDWRNQVEGQGKGGTDPEFTGYYYTEFPFVNRDGNLSVIFKHGSEPEEGSSNRSDRNNFIKFGSFQEEDDGTFCVYIDKDYNVHPGKPWGVTEEEVQGTILRLYWPESKGPGFYLQLEGEKLAEYGFLGSVYNDAWNYYEFEAEDGIRGELQYKYSYPDEPQGEINYKIEDITGKFELGDDGRYHAYVTDYEPEDLIQTLYPGIPSTGNTVPLPQFTGNEKITLIFNTNRKYLYTYIPNNFGAIEPLGQWPGKPLTNVSGRPGFKQITFNPKEFSLFNCSYFFYILNDYEDGQDKEQLISSKDMPNSSDNNYTLEITN